MEVLERELKRNNETLTRRNKLLHKSYLKQRERYIFLKRLNTGYLKDNTRLLRMVWIQRIQLKEAKENPRSHLALSNLAEAASSLLKSARAQQTLQT